MHASYTGTRAGSKWNREKMGFCQVISRCGLQKHIPWDREGVSHPYVEGTRTLKLRVGLCFISCMSRLFVSSRVVRGNKMGRGAAVHI